MGMLPSEDGKRLVQDDLGAGRQASDLHCLGSGAQPFVGWMSQRKAETRTSRYHRHASGCLDKFLGSLICAGAALLASAALLTGERLGCSRHRSSLGGEQAETPRPDEFSCGLFNSWINSRQKSLVKREKYPFTPKAGVLGATLDPRDAVWGAIASLGACQGGMWCGAAPRVAQCARGDYGPVSTQLEQDATQDSEEDLQAMGSRLALPLSL